jgi:hypothetical protein
MTAEKKPAFVREMVRAGNDLGIALEFEIHIPPYQKPCLSRRCKVRRANPRRVRRKR